MSDKPLGLAMIGLHHQHPRWYWPLWAHLPQYKPVMVCEADEPFLKQQNELFKLDACTDPRKVWEREDIDVVILWCQHTQMPQLVAEAAAAGKHVIVEKPCAADLAGARKIAEVAQQYPGIKISAPYCWRTHPGSVHVKQAVAGGKLGQVQAMEARLNAAGAWRYVRDNALWMLQAKEGGGPMWNLGVHWIDYLRWLTGSEVVSVSGVVSGPAGEPQRDIEDNAQAVLQFDNGAIAMLDISYGVTDSHPGKRDIYVALRGTHGAIQWAPAWECLTDEILIVSTDKPHGPGKAEDCRRVKVTSRDIPGYCGEMAWNWLADFAAAVREDRPPIVLPADMLAAVQVVDAFARSVRSGRRETVARS